MRRFFLNSIFALFAMVSSTSVWAVDGAGCLKTFMRWSGDTFVLSAPTSGNKPSEEYRKRSLTPTSVCRGIGVQSVEIGTQGQKVLFAQLKWKASRNLPVLESLPVGIQGAISAQIIRVPDMAANHGFEWPEFSKTSFIYSIYRRSDQYQETVSWGSMETFDEQ